VSDKSKSTAALPYTAENGQLAPFIALDCRGLEVTNFHFRGRWLVETEEGTKFEADLEEGEERWDDYDEKTESPVSISEFKSEVSRV
jgi:hypothetical protein